MRSLNAWEPSLFLILCLVGAGIGLVTIAPYDQPAEPGHLGTLPGFFAWVALRCVLFAFLPIVMVQGVATFRVFLRRIPHTYAVAVNLILSVLIIVCLFLVPSAAMLAFDSVRPEFPADLYGQRYERAAILAIMSALIAVLPAVASLMLLTIDARQSRELDQRTLIESRRHLGLLLLILGAIIGLGTLTTGCLQLALAEYESVNALPVGQFSFPKSMTLLLGAYYSTILILVYIPAQRAWRDAAIRFADSHAPVPEPTDASWSDAAKKNTQLREVLGIRQSLYEDLRAHLVLLAPMIGGVVSYAL
jgi:hypothetical protein